MGAVFILDVVGRTLEYKGEYIFNTYQANSIFHTKEYIILAKLSVCDVMP